MAHLYINKNLVEGYPMLSYPISPYLIISKLNSWLSKLCLDMNKLSIMKLGESSLTVVTNAFYKHGFTISYTFKAIRGKLKLG